MFPLPENAQSFTELVLQQANFRITQSSDDGFERHLAGEKVTAEGTSAVSFHAERSHSGKILVTDCAKLSVTGTLINFAQRNSSHLRTSPWLDDLYTYTMGEEWVRLVNSTGTALSESRNISALYEEVSTWIFPIKHLNLIAYNFDMNLSTADLATALDHLGNLSTLKVSQRRQLTDIANYPSDLHVAKLHVLTQVKLLEKRKTTNNRPGFWQRTGYLFSDFEESICWFIDPPKNITQSGK